MTKLKDNDIREILISELYSKYINDTNTKIVNEMGVLHGHSRVDVAVINGILHGYEIKSESDTLNRLPSQINDYCKVFDRMTIVVQRNYLDKTKEIIPKWWGVILVTKNGGKLNLRQLRKGRLNPNIDPYALTHLLWREEALNILKEKDLHKGYLSKPRNIIYKRICEVFTTDELKFKVNQLLKHREGWKDHDLLRLNGDLLPQ
ncbi:sce7726 family protein [Bacillus sp. RG28]|uniref:Sce7726 family protein n=1 Tax=Gottfriedia endophytica TaxID=2820819 RepID=A0A940SKA1_9BACI|nr:sce7726 family protein [Gottfriedia endophytica]MBP0726860.1 sce7726 family protein [Gottfriedia endophytica]